MSIFTPTAILIIAIIHLVISIVEMFFWNNSIIYQRLDYTAELAAKVAPIVANAGLYNGFIAAGWSAFSNNKSLSVFFLVCVIIAGIFGALTLKSTTLFIQTLPAFIVLTLVLIEAFNSRRRDSLTHFNY